MTALGALLFYVGFQDLQGNAACGRGEVRPRPEQPRSSAVKDVRVVLADHS